MLCSRWLAGAALVAAAVLSLQAQPAKETAPEIKGIPPRATPGDYQFQSKAGDYTIAAEFTGHSLPTDQGSLTTPDYVAVEAAVFGPAKLRISVADFSLRLNKKKIVQSVPYGMTFSSLKDPEWVPPEGDPSSKKSKGGISTGGGGQGGSNDPPPPVKIPVEVQRAMAHRVQRAAMPEGDRELPVAGLIFFQYRAKTENLESIELVYEGPAGKATLKLQ